jgi:AcrR family transcriptional regulator
VARTGRRPGESGAREAILEAARQAFTERGYDGASLRGIARAAGVDPALVLHYFRDKQQLFVTAVRFPFDPAVVVDQVLAGGREHVGESIVRFFLSVGEDEARRGAIIGILRSAVTNEHAAAMLREFVSEALVGRIADRLGVPHARLRPTLVASQMVGLFLFRYVIRLEPLASASPEELVAAVAPNIQRYVSGDLGLPGDRR